MKKIGYAFREVKITWCQCDVCKLHFPLIDGEFETKFSYCPRCGAKLEDYE